MSINEFDLRQYKKIQDILDGIGSSPGISDLGSAINSLEFLLVQLQQPDSNWVDSFRRNWWVLEELYAVVLEKKRGHFETGELNIIMQSRDTMTALVKSKMT